MYDVTNGIIDYEDGSLDDDRVVELFQHLIESGLAWKLQGHYGRTAERLIRAGLCTIQKTVKPSGLAYEGTHEIGGSD